MSIGRPSWACFGVLTRYGLFNATAKSLTDFDGVLVEQKDRNGNGCDSSFGCNFSTKLRQRETRKLLF